MFLGQRLKLVSFAESHDRCSEWLRGNAGVVVITAYGGLRRRITCRVIGATSKPFRGLQLPHIIYIKLNVLLLIREGEDSIVGGGDEVNPSRANDKSLWQSF